MIRRPFIAKSMSNFDVQITPDKASRKLLCKAPPRLLVNRSFISKNMSSDRNNFLKLLNAKFPFTDFVKNGWL